MTYFEIGTFPQCCFFPRSSHVVPPHHPPVIHREATGPGRASVMMGNLWYHFACCGMYVHMGVDGPRRRRGRIVFYCNINQSHTYTRTHTQRYIICGCRPSSSLEPCGSTMGQETNHFMLTDNFLLQMDRMDQWRLAIVGRHVSSGSSVVVLWWGDGINRLIVWFQRCVREESLPLGGIKKGSMQWNMQEKWCIA